MSSRSPFQGAFTGKMVLVSGGTSGIGLAIARGFAEAGGDVLATGSSAGRLAAARKGDTLKGLRFEQLDVRDWAAVEAMVGGLDRLDVLVNCQGVVRPDLEWQEQDFLDVMDINLHSAMRLSRAAYPLLRQGRGSIVNIASMLSFLADGSVPAYCASKSGFLGLTRALAHQWGHRVFASMPSLPATTRPT